MTRHQRVNILLIDDQPVRLADLEAVLQPMGQNLVCAASGEDALQWVQREDFAVILLAAEMDGLETARLLGEFKGSPSIPLIFISSSEPGDPAGVEAYRLGAVDYLCRPVAAEMLRAKVSVFVEIARTTALQHQTECDLRRQNQDLLKQNLSVQEATRLKSQFLTSMSHELRTPLNAIIGFTELMNDGLSGRLTRRQKEYLGTILNSSHHLLGLINSILDLAKIESGKSELYLESIDLADLVDEVRTSLGSLATRKRIRMESTVDSSLTGLVVDPAKVKQILYNYLSNALKFTPEEGRVFIRARPEGDDTFRVEVEDDGVGIAPQDLDRLFIEFQQIGRTQDRKCGTGLGLALTKRMVEAQGGEVGVQSQLQRGSVFYAILPRIVSNNGTHDIFTPPETDRTPSRRRTSQPPLTVEPSLSGPPVLIVEDNVVNLQLVTVLLERKGFRVFAVNTAEEAAAVLPDLRPHLILMDMQLPGMSGYDFTRAFKSNGQTRDIVVIAMTASAMKGDRQKALEAGCDAYVTKPIDTRALPEMVILYLGPPETRPTETNDRWTATAQPHPQETPV